MLHRSEHGPTTGDLMSAIRTTRTTGRRALVDIRSTAPCVHHHALT